MQRILLREPRLGWVALFFYSAEGQQYDASKIRSLRVLVS